MRKKVSDFTFVAPPAKEESKQTKPRNKKVELDWTVQCENCGATPIVPVTGMCGPCTFGEADTAGGNW